jgi:DNA-directed RNA polymerase subunit N (RpoN/RPB10)
MSDINQRILDEINVAQGREENKKFLDDLGITIHVCEISLHMDFTHTMLEEI